ncbi:DUF2808 domain-containing protein [Leptolyngbya sp. AN03gr2]|uniref:DUF2808 domain-containing protein n=1 Tax=unclassified Leptolyngbya TaxID=2650499 RepID=UPI003D314C4F
MTSLIAGTTVTISVLSLPVLAGQSSNGRTFFDRSPRLVRSFTSRPISRFPSTYEFTITVPENAGAPLQAVTISQNSTEGVEFDPSKSVAFLGDRYGVGAQLPLSGIGGTESSSPRKSTIVFNQPVQPGSTVTIALEAKRNPNSGGIYLFGVTAHPVGDKADGLFLGYGRLTFYDQGG